VEIREYTGQAARRGAFQRAEPEQAMRCCAGDDAARFVRQLNEALGIAKKKFAAGGEVQPLPVAMKQRNSDGGFQLLDARGDIRWCAVQFICGLDDSAFFHHGSEHLKIGEIH